MKTKYYNPAFKIWDKYTKKFDSMMNHNIKDKCEYINKKIENGKKPFTNLKKLLLPKL